MTSSWTTKTNAEAAEGEGGNSSTQTKETTTVKHTYKALSWEPEGLCLIMYMSNSGGLRMTLRGNDHKPNDYIKDTGMIPSQEVYFR